MPTTARRRTSRWITSGIFGKARTPLSSTRAGWRLSNAASSTTNRCRRRKKAPTIPSGKKNRSATIKGENPIKANGKLLVIDGGFSKAYHPETGIAGYTLVYHSRGFQLVQHEPFLSTDQAIKEGKDIRSTTIVVELNSHRQMVKDTDKGADLQQQIHDLEKLLYAFRNGFIKEKERYK